MQILLCLGLLCLPLLLLADTTPEEPTDNYDALFSDEIDDEFLPCRSWMFPCGNSGYQCTSQEAYYNFIFGPPLGCPITFNSTTVAPPTASCSIANNTCGFMEDAALCVSWLPNCSDQYSCTTADEMMEATADSTDTCNAVYMSPPTPASVCTPINNTCEWRNPCRAWQSSCGERYVCGDEAQYAGFLYGPHPICANPPNATLPVPAGECIYQDGQCEWSECRSWLSPCQTSWQCGSDYEYRQAQIYPPPPCPYPGIYFVPPPEPGMCQYNVEAGQCQFQGEPVCTGGQQYRKCGSACPRTCDNYQLDFLCTLNCVPGCFCPSDTVLHEGECIPSSMCPDEDPCSLVLCEPGYECQVYEETGETFCSPNCEDFNPCGPEEICVITTVYCIRSPCPGVLSCEEDPCNATSCDPGYECQIYEETGATFCSPNCEELNPCGPQETCVINPVYCITAPCPGVLSCEASCPEGMEWDSCGSACPRTCANYDEVLGCTRECVRGCFCPQGTVLNDEEECVPISDCPGYITPCAYTDCAPGYACQVYETTNEAYCEPVCSQPHVTSLCGVGANCTLIERDCDGREPCPHTYECFLPPPTCKAWRHPCFNQSWICSSYEEYVDRPRLRCPVYETSALVPHPGQCVPIGDTCQFRANCTGGKEWQECGTACPLTCDNYDTDFACTKQCVEGCFCPEGKVELDGICVDPSKCSECDKCKEGQICSVIQEDRLNGQYVMCRGPNGVACSEDTLSCSSNSRCLTHNTTGTSFCLESCYLENGGCSDDQVCYYDKRDEDCNPLLESCFKATCTDIPDETGVHVCPIGWERGECASACPPTCEDYLEPKLKICPAVCAPCQCPRGMVVFRDRCVDPLECYTLMTESIPINPLPQPENVALIKVTLIGESPDTFDGSQFAASVQRLFSELELNSPRVSMYAVFVEDGNTIAVLKLEGNAVMNSSSDFWEKVIMENRDELSVKVAAVSTVETPEGGGDDEEDDEEVPVGVAIGSTIAVIVVCCITLVILIIVVVAVVKMMKKMKGELELPEKGKQIGKLTNIDLVSKLDDTVEKDYV